MLELLADSNHGLAMPELMRRLSLSRSSAYYLLVTLERRGYLHRSATSGRYTFGLKLLEIAKTSMSRNDLRERAQPFMRRVAEATGLTVHLGVIEEDQAIVIAKSAPPFSSGTSTWVGTRMHLHSSAIGKVLLAHLPASEVDRIVRRQRLPRFNDNTITSPAKLAGELERVRTCGYGCEREEEEIGFRCVAAPVRDNRGTVVAAVSLSGTTDQITDETAGSHIGAICQLAAQIGGRLECMASTKALQPAG